MKRMAQEIQQIGRTGSLAARHDGGAGYTSWTGQARSNDRLVETSMVLDLSGPLLTALGDEPSRRILNSAILEGKTVEEISAEQGLPLSTCYRKVRFLVDGGLLLLERMVVTKTGKRFAVYRSSFSEAKIDFINGGVAVEVTPNPQVLDKLRRRWLETAYQAPEGQRDSLQACSPPRLGRQSSSPFE